MKILKKIWKAFRFIIYFIIQIPAYIIISLGLMIYALAEFIKEPIVSITLIKHFFKTLKEKIRIIYGK